MIGADKLVSMQFIDDVRRFPLVLQPEEEVALAEWAQSNKEFIEECLLKYGAILFRNFGLSSIPDFEQVALRICGELFGDYGDLPRAGVGSRIYEATPYPADRTILFHNESSHMHQWPMKILFFCEEPARQGGETPLVSCREVYRQVPRVVRERLARRGIMYLRNFSAGIDVSWQQFFNTEDKVEVEDKCRKTGLQFEWTDEGGLRTCRRCQAIATHPKTGEPVFFNQIQLYHQAYLDARVRQALKSLFSEQDLPRQAYYGDGTSIEDEVAEEIGQIYWRESVSFPWQKGDLLVLDNMLVAHARLPFVGPRRIVVAMGEVVHSEYSLPITGADSYPAGRPR